MDMSNFYPVSNNFYRVNWCLQITWPLTNNLTTVIDVVAKLCCTSENLLYSFTLTIDLREHFDYATKALLQQLFHRGLFHCANQHVVFDTVIENVELVYEWCLQHLPMQTAELKKKKKNNRKKISGLEIKISQVTEFKIC